MKRITALLLVSLFWLNLSCTEAPSEVEQPTVLEIEQSHDASMARADLSLFLGKWLHQNGVSIIRFRKYRKLIRVRGKGQVIDWAGVGRPYGSELLVVAETKRHDDPALQDRLFFVYYWIDENNPDIMYHRAYDTNGVQMGGGYQTRMD